MTIKYQKIEDEEQIVFKGKVRIETWGDELEIHAPGYPLDRQCVKMLIEHLQSWLDTGSLKIDTADSAPEKPPGNENTEVGRMCLWLNGEVKTLERSYRVEQAAQQGDVEVAVMVNVDGEQERFYPTMDEYESIEKMALAAIKRRYNKDRDSFKASLRGILDNLK